MRISLVTDMKKFHSWKMSKIPRAGEKRRHNEGGPRHWKNAMGLLNSVFKIPLLQTSNTYLKCALGQNPLWSRIRINKATKQASYTVEKIFQVTNEIAHIYVNFVTLLFTILDKFGFILDILHKIRNSWQLGLDIPHTNYGNFTVM